MPLTVKKHVSFEKLEESYKKAKKNTAFSLCM